MKTPLRTAPFLLPAALLAVAAVALAGWRTHPAAGHPHVVSLAFPSSAPAAAVAADLTACATIEEAMLFKLMGVLRNRSDAPLRYATAHVEFRDGRGEMLDRSQGLTVPEVIEPGEEGRFVLVTRMDPRIASVFTALADADGAPLPADYSLREPPQGFVHP